uniref:Uncharacterized protein n=1 Tax=Caenorhabditis tropicalis TaxID=1561998 RepID=A0A1I7USN7_9PELO
MYLHLTIPRIIKEERQLNTFRVYTKGNNECICLRTSKPLLPFFHRISVSSSFFPSCLLVINEHGLYRISQPLENLRLLTDSEIEESRTMTQKMEDCDVIEVYVEVMGG